MKKVILIFVLAAFAMIAVGQEPLFKKSSNSVSSKCIKGKIYTTYEYFDYYFYSGKTIIKSIKFKKADLNDYFNPEEADWNATELYDDDIEYLRSKNVEHCDTVVQGKRFVGWYVVIRDTKTEKNSITPKPKKKEPQTSSYMREI